MGEGGRTAPRRRLTYDRIMSEEPYPMAWPDVPRLCFGAGSPAHLNACVGWEQTRPDGMLGYVEGYRNAAVALFEASVEKPVSPDFLVFPLAFLWRHHVELALKDIIAIGRQLRGEPWGFPEHHRLLMLWKEARPYVVECGDPSAPEPANVEANIQEFETIAVGHVARLKRSVQARVKLGDEAWVRTEGTHARGRVYTG